MSPTANLEGMVQSLPPVPTSTVASPMMQGLFPIPTPAYRPYLTAAPATSVATTASSGQSKPPARSISPEIQVKI